ncbi:hypothetical protein [Solimonas soli]|uniref:hypothetical protein n=1 Tax=Solimonas soli TaxID=413479 RepID=UPI000488D1BF|nr:hypothetical protein [Solimonas soli]
MNDFFQLQEPLTDGGIRSVNFFNGRLLAGRDLTREQEARREAERRLGRALGDGVASGLDVSVDIDTSTAQAPVLKVKAGLALNRYGQTLNLAGDTRVALTRKLDAASDGGCVFAACLPIGGGTYVAGAGVYLLTLAPAQTSEGRAQSNGLDPGNVRCNNDATVEALQFRLLAIKPERYADLDPASPRFRNRLAYRCFGIEARAQALADPWRDDPAGYGLIDTLRAEGGALGDYDVPLALLYWTAAGLQFIDAWAVRRRLLGPDALSAFAFSARARRLIEAEAMCAQFQMQLGELLAASATPASLHVRDAIQYLPPFGLVPLQNGALRGFGDAAFFDGIPRRPLPGSGQTTPFIDARMLGALREQALTYAPTDVDAQEFVWVYRPWQTVQAMSQGRLVQPLLVFASGLVPDLVLARFDMARFDFSNFAEPDAF